MKYTKRDLYSRLWATLENLMLFVHNCGIYELITNYRDCIHNNTIFTIVIVLFSLSLSPNNIHTYYTTHTHIHMYICMYTHTYAYIPHIHAPHSQTHICTQQTQTHTHTYTRIHTHTHIHTYVHKYTHTYTHKHTHTHTWLTSSECSDIIGLTAMTIPKHHNSIILYTWHKLQRVIYIQTYQSHICYHSQCRKDRISLTRFHWFLNLTN